MQTRDVFEHCIQFVGELEGHETELDLAEKMGKHIEDSDLDLLVVHKLKKAIEILKPYAAEIHHTKLLYHIAQYANIVGKPRLSIPLGYIAINQPNITDKYRTLIMDLLTEIRLKLPEDVYQQEVKKTTLDVESALDDAYEWLTQQEKHASQPATKQVFNSDLLKKPNNKADD